MRVATKPYTFTAAVLAAAALAALLLFAVARQDASASTKHELVAVGDLADDSHAARSDNHTAKLVENSFPNAAIAVVGDLAYESGSLSQFNTYYHDNNVDTAYSWGITLNDRVHPVPGNHEYKTTNAQGYIDYFTQKGVAIGQSGRLWYAWDVPDSNWRAIAVNSSISMAGGSAQHTFVSNELKAAKNAGKNTVLYLHHPFYSSENEHGWRQSTSTNKLPCSASSTPSVRPIFKLMDDLGGDLVLAGHSHSYERFEPMDENGTVYAGGVPSFVVGTGGKSLRLPGDRYPTDWNGDCGLYKPQSAFYDYSKYAVLGVDLGTTSFSFEQRAVDGTVVDSGTFGVR